MEEDEKKSYDFTDHHGSIKDKDVKQIYEEAKTLVSVVRHSNQYESYQECLSQLKEDKKYYEKFLKFQKEYFKVIQKSEDSFQEIEELNRKYRDVLSNEKVQAFMEANDRLCAVLKEMYEILGEGIEMDLSFLAS